MLDLLQWPAMAVTLAAAWLVASRQRKRRLIGFGTFVASNLLWVIWAWPAGAHGVIALQVGLLALNIRGVMKNE